MTDPALKPCPFCGGTHITYDNDDAGKWLHCGTCDFALQVAYGQDVEAMWNRRAAPTWTATLDALSARSMQGITIRYRRQPGGTPWPAPWQAQHHSTKWIDSRQTAYGHTLPEALQNLLAVLRDKAGWMGGWPE